jgi:hypothetical protein
MQKDLKELVGAGGRTKKDNGKSMLQQCATDLTEQARLGARITTGQRARVPLSAETVIEQA